jgi:hypothetical protein
VTAELGEQIGDDWRSRGSRGEMEVGGLGGGVASRNGGGEARRRLGSSCRKSGEELGFGDFGDERWRRLDKPAGFARPSYSTF